MSDAPDLWRSVGLVAIPAGQARELLRNEFSGSARLLSYEDGDILGLCRVFRSAADHAAEICREAALPGEHVHALAAQISFLAREGLLVRKADLLARLAPVPAPPLPPLVRADAAGATWGGRLNAAILASRGRRFLFGDGLLRSADPKFPAALDSDPVLSPAEAPGPPGDLLQEHARVLGAPLGNAVGRDVDLDRLDARFLRRLRIGDGLVAATQHGSFGRLVLTNRPLALEGPLGLDGRLLLPPAPEVDAGAREVFLLVLRKVWDRALLALLPGVVETADAPTGPRPLADLLLALLAPFELGPAKPEGPPRFRALSDHLESVAAMDVEEFRALLRPLAWMRDAARLGEAALLQEVPDLRAAILAYAGLLRSWAS